MSDEWERSVEDFPLTEKEIETWVENLGDSDTSRAKRIRHLLHYADSDEMSLRDREICREQLSKLDTKAGFKLVKGRG